MVRTAHTYCTVPVIICVYICLSSLIMPVTAALSLADLSVHAGH